VCEVLTVVVLWRLYVNNLFMLTTALVYLALNISLVTLMVVNKRPVVDADITVIESIQDQSLREEPLIKKSECWLEVKI
jgi:hypothetical protein